ncbi:hypothetical protein P692DRAFT_201873879 [Suillus brevipes Sb2]|nr:hypothetical protein P692DRAFT_201873879 [Suillus brevipes Sb2]
MAGEPAICAPAALLSSRTIPQLGISSPMAENYVLSSYQALKNVEGMLALSTPSDRLTFSICDTFSHVELGVFHWTSHAPDTYFLGLSERNLACLKVLLSSALFLAGSLGESWYGALEALHKADYVLNAKALRASTNLGAR